jgi:hypothetical protein
MKWKNQNGASKDAKRIVTRFLFLPKSVGDETRWLERATWEEKSVPFYSWVGGLHGFSKEPTSFEWEPVRWIDEGAIRAKNSVVQTVQNSPGAHVSA